MLSKNGPLAKMWGPGMWKKSILFRNAWPIFFFFTRVPYSDSFKMALKNNRSGRRKILPLDGGSFLSVLQTVKCKRYNKEMFTPKPLVLTKY